jgi:hypothetical protein
LILSSALAFGMASSKGSMQWFMINKLEQIFEVIDMVLWALHFSGWTSMLTNAGPRMLINYDKFDQ